MRSEPITPETVTQTVACEFHGEFEQRATKILNTVFRSHCPTCTAEKAVEDAAKEAADKAAENRRIVADKLGSSAVPKRFACKSFDDFQPETPRQKKALTTCTDYVEDFSDHLRAGRCLLMFGKPGTGKTHLAAAIANRINARTRHSAAYRTVGGILQSLKASYSPGAERSESQIMAGLIGPDLLIIDEVGATKPTEFEQATLFAVINGRYEEMRPTVVISNLDPHELPAALGERCVDRLREGGGIALVFDWKSVRSEVRYE